MPHTIVLGGGLCGLAAALMLARDGHRVTVLERDLAPVPADPEAAWESWNRAGVTQFRQAHYLQPGGRHVLEAELPDVLHAFQDAGALRFDPIAAMPPTVIDRAPREGDERFVTWTARRSTLEQVVGRAAATQDGLVVRRGVSAAALETGAGRVVAVRTSDGERVAGDLVVDAMGRGSSLPRLLSATGAAAGKEAGDDGGFLYYTRHFRGEVAHDPRADQLRPRHLLAAHAARRRRHLVGHGLRLNARPLAEGRARSGALDAAGAGLPAPRALARRRAADRRDGDGRRAEPRTDGRARSRRRRQPRRRVGLHEPGDGTRDHPRPRARRAAAACGARPRRPSPRR